MFWTDEGTPFTSLRPMSSRRSELEPRLRVSAPVAIGFGPGKAELLRLISKNGSIIQSAALVKMSYDPACTFKTLANGPTGVDWPHLARAGRHWFAENSLDRQRDTGRSWSVAPQDAPTAGPNRPCLRNCGAGGALPTRRAALGGGALPGGAVRRGPDLA